MSETIEEYTKRIGCESVEEYMKYLKEKWKDEIDRIVEIDGHPVLVKAKS